MKVLGRESFFWDDENSAIALGYGSIYNHADDFNAKFFIDRDDVVVRFKAVKPIAVGEEIFVNYGKDWFTTREMEKVSLDEQNEKNRMGLYKFFGVIIILFLLAKIFPIQSSSNISPSVQSEIAKNG